MLLGNEHAKQELEKKVDDFDDEAYWQAHSDSPQVIAAANRDKVPRRKGNLRDLLNGSTNSAPEESPRTSNANKLDNPFKSLPSPGPSAESSSSPPQPSSTPHTRFSGLLYARQLSETVPSFLSRLPPSTTSPSTIGSWLWIENPNTPLRSSTPNADIAAFRTRGREHLEAFLHTRARLEEEKQDHVTTTATTRDLINAEREVLEQKLRRLARDSGITGGKWLIFVYKDKLDEKWGKVATATAEGSLGCAAKVATSSSIDSTADDPEDGHGNVGAENPTEREKDEDPHATRLICIYTHDCEDVADIKRVLLRLREIGAFNGGEPGRGQRRHPIHYKCDAWTHLELKRGNHYGLKASMYSSGDLLGEGNRARRGNGKGRGSRSGSGRRGR